MFTRSIDVTRVTVQPSDLCLLPLTVSLCSIQCFHVPYSALTMFLSTDQKERDSATAYRKIRRLTLLFLRRVVL